MKTLLALLIFTCSVCFADVEQMMAFVPNTSTAVTTETTYVQLLMCSTTSATTLTVTDTAGTDYFNAVSLSANQTTLVYSAGATTGSGRVGLKMVGIKWSAGNANAVKCQLQGYNPPR